MQNIKKYFMTLALLITAVTGAWAQDADEVAVTKTANNNEWTLTMPASNVELQVEYFAESNLFLGKEALADKDNITVKNGETTVEFGDDGKSANTVTEGNTVTTTYTGTKKVLGVKVEKKAGDTGKSLAEATVGMIIGSNGKAYAADDKDNMPEGVTVAAKVCYVDGNGHGLALALTDEEGYKEWSTAKTTCDAHTPAITGGTWKLASQAEWNSMISAAGSYTALRNGFNSVGGTNMQSAAYWSSTEEGNAAWDFSFENGVWCDDSKESTYCVRACLAF